MLKCSEVVEQASDFVDENLPWYSSLRIKMHLLMCVHCRRFLRHFSATIDLAEPAGRRQATATEIERVMKHIDDIDSDI
ncbi:MAG: zf-HC2 domain-containing protein [Halieaceae bacterium]|jgi:hypothetical protein|nr:zf-HC2 domain-containing protein [Halieaceae bacterium]